MGKTLLLRALAYLDELEVRERQPVMQNTTYTPAADTPAIARFGRTRARPAACSCRGAARQRLASPAGARRCARQQQHAARSTAAVLQTVPATGGRHAQVMYVHQSRINYKGSPSDFFEQVCQFCSQRGRPHGDLGALVQQLGLEPGVLQQPWSELSVRERPQHAWLCAMLFGCVMLQAQLSPACVPRLPPCCAMYHKRTGRPGAARVAGDCRGAAPKGAAAGRADVRLRHRRRAQVRMPPRCTAAHVTSSSGCGPFGRLRRDCWFCNGCCCCHCACRVEALLRGCQASVLWVTHDPLQVARTGGRVLELPSGAISSIVPLPFDPETGVVDAAASAGGSGSGSQHGAATPHSSHGSLLAVSRGEGEAGLVC